jgi:hypothetical protein
LAAYGLKAYSAEELLVAVFRRLVFPENTGMLVLPGFQNRQEFTMSNLGCEINCDRLKASIRQQANAGEDVVEGILVQNYFIVISSIQLLGGFIDQIEVLLAQVLVEPVDQGDLSVLQLDRRNAPLSDAAAGVEQAGNEQLRVVDTTAAFQLPFPLVDFLELHLVALDILGKPPLLPGARRRILPTQLFDPKAQRIDLGQGFEQGPVGVADQRGDPIGVGERIDPPLGFVLTEGTA